MEFQIFLSRIIDDGIAAARASYASDPHKQQGSIEGFEACRGKRPDQLPEILDGAARAATLARRSSTLDLHEYWRLRCRELEIEWVCNVVSCVLRAPIVEPTTRGLHRAAEILGPSGIISEEGVTKDCREEMERDGKVMR